MALFLPRLLLRLALAALAGALMWLYASGLPRQTEDEAVRAELGRSAAPQRIEAAIGESLKRSDVEDAAAYAELADYAGLPVSSELRQKIADALVEERSWADRIKRCARGVFMGDMTGALSAICTLAADFTPVGDARDIAIQGGHWFSGQDYDRVVLGLSALGLGATAFAYASAGTGLPAKAGLSVLKGARRSGAMNPKLWMSPEKIGAGGGAKLARAAEELNAVRREFGSAEAVKMLRYAEKAEDIGEISKLYAKFGRKARPIMALTGKTAIASFKVGYKLTATLSAQIAAILGSGFTILLALGLRRRIMRRAFAPQPASA